MKSWYSILAFVMLWNVVNSQILTGPELLDKSIEYHDPDGNWSKFHVRLKLTQDTPTRKDQKALVEFDVWENRFKHAKESPDGLIVREVFKDSCVLKLNGKLEFSEELAKKHRLNCERSQLLRNYYIYLYGLPMKLKDHGTKVHEEVKEIEFQGRPCFALKVTYDQAVGDDIWYFYFDKTSYALIGYRFYHDESKNDGEYIILEEEFLSGGIRIPKIRSWYYNKDDKFLGTDTLKEAVVLKKESEVKIEG